MYDSLIVVPVSVPQIIEMRQWFQAWRDSNSTLRDYRKYFKPLLCYIEGAWTNDVTDVDEPFDSDRHHIAAESWLELQEQIRWVRRWVVGGRGGAGRVSEADEEMPYWLVVRCDNCDPMTD